MRHSVTLDYRGLDGLQVDTQGRGRPTYARSPIYKLPPQDYKMFTTFRF
jgi:hypothetical protein